MRLAIKPKKNQSFVDRYFEQKQDQTFRILVSERLHQTFLEHSFPMMKLEMITTIFVSKKKNGSKAQYLALAWLNVVRKNCDISRFIPVYLHCIYAFCSRNSYSADAKKTICISLEKWHRSDQETVFFVPLSKGGLNFPCFRTTVKALRPSWISRL